MHGFNDSLDNQVLSYLNYKQTDSFIPSSIGRLDRVTSGLIIYAKTYSALVQLNNKINLFKRNYNNYKNKELYSFKSSLFPLKLSLIEQTNVITNERILTLEEALELAKKKSRDKIKLNEKEYIISEKQLKESIFNSKIEIEMFYSVYEDITEYEYLE